MPDFLDEKRQEIAARLKEIKPLVDEYARLQNAADALGKVGTTSPSSRNGSAAEPAAPRRRGRPRKAKTTPLAPKTTAKAAPKAGKAKRKAGRRKGSGARATQALAFVTEQPGITIPELANRMGIKQNYLYRVLPALKDEGRVSKQGRGWHPAGSKAG